MYVDTQFTCHKAKLVNLMTSYAGTSPFFAASLLRLGRADYFFDK